MNRSKVEELMSIWTFLNFDEAQMKEKGEEFLKDYYASQNVAIGDDEEEESDDNNGGVEVWFSQLELAKCCMIFSESKVVCCSFDKLV